MNRATILFGLFCLVVGMVLGALIAVYFIPTTPKYQDAQAALILAQAKVKEAEAERLKVDARADELALAQTVEMRVASMWVNAIVVPLAAVVMALACVVALRRKPEPPAAQPVGRLPMMPAMGYDQPPATKSAAQFIYVRGNGNDRELRDIKDVREFLERGASLSFARATWVGVGFRFSKSGHPCTRERYEALRKMAVDANVLENIDGTYKLKCSLADALDCFSDGETEVI
jgi:hypothetical protein